MATTAQIHANIRNAKHSTGPATKAGKSASSKNAVKHGLSAGTLFLREEDQAPFYELKRDLRQEHRPQGATEDYLVEQMATALWLVRRAVGLQAAAFNSETSGEAPKSLALYMRYQSNNERSFYKALETLRKLQKEKAAKRTDDHIGFLLHATPEEFVAKMAEAYKIENDGEELAPETIATMLERSRHPETPAAAPAR